MSLVSNPEQISITVPVANGYKVILVLKGYKTKAYTAFLKSRFDMKRNQLEDNANEARIKFIDKHLVNVTAVNKEGEEEKVQYLDDNGEEQELTPSVPDWLELVNVSWKISAAVLLEGDSQQAEITVKN